jgi:hypothetical protein
MYAILTLLSVVLFSACATGAGGRVESLGKIKWQPRQRLGAPHTIVVIRGG